MGRDKGGKGEAKKLWQWEGPGEGVGEEETGNREDWEYSHAGLADGRMRD